MAIDNWVGGCYRYPNADAGNTVAVGAVGKVRTDHRPASGPYVPSYGGGFLDSRGVRAGFSGIYGKCINHACQPHRLHRF